MSGPAARQHPVEGLNMPLNPSGIQAGDVGYSGAGRTGQIIYRHRAASLLPLLLAPVFLLNNPDFPPVWFRILAYAAGGMGMAMRVLCTGYRTWAHKSSGQRHLMTAGPYGRMRHPLYAANFLVFLPLFLLANVWWLTAIFVAWFAVLHLAIVRREEEVLDARYGAEWSAYSAAVRRWIPRIRPYEPAQGGFSIEPIIKGREPVHLALWAGFFICHEILRSGFVSFLDSLQDAVGIYPWN